MLKMWNVSSVLKRVKMSKISFQSGLIAIIAAISFQPMISSAESLKYPNGQEMQESGKFVYPDGGSVIVAGRLIYPNGSVMSIGEEAFYSGVRPVMIRQTLVNSQGQVLAHEDECYDLGGNTIQCPTSLVPEETFGDYRFYQIFDLHQKAVIERYFIYQPFGMAHSFKIEKDGQISQRGH
jgi:hypothetical protein